MKNSKIVKYRNIFFDVFFGILVFVSIMLVGAILWLLLIFHLTEKPNNSDRDVALHFGKYDAEHRRTGTWEIKSSYLLSNGNDGSSHIEGNYDKGLRVGVWCINDSYGYEVQVYNEGILQESLRFGWGDKISYERYENGRMQEFFFSCYLDRDNNKYCPNKAILLNFAKRYNTLAEQCTKTQIGYFRLE